MTSLPRASTVPTVVDALVAALKTLEVSDLALEIQDGPKPKASKRKVIAVGVGDEAVIYSVTPDQRAGGWVYNESYDVVCVAWSWGGTQVEQSEHRANVGAMLHSVRTAVDTLNTVLDAQAITLRMGIEGGWQQIRSGEGFGCIKGFAVHATATI